MTALPTPNLNSDRFDWSEWIGLSDAAERLRVDKDHLGRLCKRRLQAEGVAIMATTPDGGRRQWFISRRYDAALIGGIVGAAHRPADLSRFTDDQIRGARMRQACVLRFRAARKAGGDGWVGRCVEALRGRYTGLRISRRSLYGWDRDYNGRADLVKLIDMRGGDQKSKGDRAAWAHFGELYLHPNQRSAKACWKATKRHAQQAGLSWCSYESLKRQLNRRFTPQQQAQARDPDTFRNHFAPYLKQNPDRFGAGDCWVGDHTQLDFMCWWGKDIIRAWLTTFQDWRTRRIVGYMVWNSPSSHTIRGALRHALMDSANGGPPRALWIDNGRDFDSWVLHGQTKKSRREKVISAGYVDEIEFRGILNDFDPPIEAHFSLPFNPNGKSRMERWYGTLHGQFDKWMTTYCGRNPLYKPENLNHTLKHERHRIPTFEQVQAWVGDFITAFNANADHQMADMVDHGETLSPDQAMARWRSMRRVFADPSILDELMAHWHRPLHVGRNGIDLRFGTVKLTYGQFAPELIPFKAAKKADRRPVIVAYDPHDMRRVRVYDAQRRYVCTAEENILCGVEGKVGMEQLREQMRKKTAYARHTKGIQANPDINFLTDSEAIAAESIRQTAEAETAASLQPVRTRLDGQGKAIRRDDLRHAAGAETVTRPDDEPRGLPSPREMLRYLPANDGPDSDYGEDDAFQSVTDLHAALTLTDDGDGPDDDGDYDDDQSPWAAFRERGL
ncbi:MAG: Mu transposase C-terminal domain-containing protein [Phycisphaerales bacterium]